jgi:CxxC motif-containing protein
MSITTYLCIGCPLGCRLEVEEDAQGALIAVRGFSCKRGREYAIQEHTAPQRVVTTTVTIRRARGPRLPVRTSAPVPKPLVRAVCRALRGVVVDAPVRMGQVIVADVLATGVDVIATRDMPTLAPDCAVEGDGTQSADRW